MAPLGSSAVVPFNLFWSPSPYSVSSPRQSSHQYRVLEVETESLPGTRASAKLWIYHGEKIVTKVDKMRGPNSTWNQKFLFSVTEDFLSDEDSLLFFDVYSRPSLPFVGSKKLMGTGKCRVRDVLMGIEADEDGEVAHCTLQLGGVSGLADRTLKVKLRLWREVLEYVGAIDDRVSSAIPGEASRRKKHYCGFSCLKIA